MYAHFISMLKVIIFAKMLSGKKHHIASWAGRIFIIALLSVYLLFTIGILKSTHFCMGREASVKLFSAEAEKCACSLFAGEKDSCCDDERDLVKIENEQKSGSFLSITGPQWIKLEDLYSERYMALDKCLPVQVPYEADVSPPKIPLFKVHCSLVFYDDDSLMG